jgi:hypothetical protein
MATQITCIVPDGSDPDRRIDAVGGDGWQKLEDDVIAEIENGVETYFVDVDDKEVQVTVQKLGDTKYLRTDPDETEENNLLHLPPCS